ncbi:hypothetical protein HOP50_03g26700 [Chloropicon primus]|uniref:Uncharacterized protein n=1 Tax=Chloropicon primus TaxID=1764295 RepID=A0A5B8MIN2_9CHLO|nr:hypothetical protein A3770_03p26690 [Chloropicon primus]UPQ99363.1 hypothetical protein HOP50_03g26700 [Chloropicon primus]|mmetsp:Transcript_38679/g.83005  ORF Transcript_38679/g.83005 Transcript_38679/m.83005 type:complete len:268 (+) Transcript_38679:3-806(+)|eukprot:QDZ20151.1 hypothetical protein A3770_03p26690 [Chloropicon primus]
MARPLEEEGGAGESSEEVRPGYYKVVQKQAVAVHETMSLASAAVSFKQPGHVVRAIPVLGRGVESEWVKMTSGEGYVLAAHPTEGQALEALQPSTFKVVHKTVLVRTEASTSSKVLQIRKEGDLLLVDGHLEGWLKVHNVSQENEAEAKSLGEADPLRSAVGWVMVTHSTYGKLVQYLKGEIPTFSDPSAQEGSMKTPSSVYTGKAADPLTERLKLELDQMRMAVQEREKQASRVDGDDNLDLMRRGLMANAGQSASGSFCIGGNPV